MHGQSLLDILRKSMFRTCVLHNRKRKKRKKKEKEEKEKRLESPGKYNMQPITVIMNFFFTCKAVLPKVLNPLTSAPLCSQKDTSPRFPLADALQRWSTSDLSLSILVKRRKEEDKTKEKEKKIVEGALRVKRGQHTHTQGSQAASLGTTQSLHHTS